MGRKGPRIGPGRGFFGGAACATAEGVQKQSGKGVEVEPLRGEVSRSPRLSWRTLYASTEAAGRASVLSGLNLAARGRGALRMNPGDGCADRGSMGLDEVRPGNGSAWGDLQARREMKALHCEGFWGWSAFNAPNNIDFNGTLWVREAGNVVVDPMPLSEHDRAHLQQLGGAAWVVITNSDHIRSAEEVAAWTGARMAAPLAEKSNWPFPCERWLADGDELVPGLQVLALEGSKTPGELCLLIKNHTLVMGDLVRAHGGGSLMMLPDAKLRDRDAAVASVERLTQLPHVETVLLGDGWHFFRAGITGLKELLNRLRPAD